MGHGTWDMGHGTCAAYKNCSFSLDYITPPLFGFIPFIRIQKGIAAGDETKRGPHQKQKFLNYENTFYLLFGEKNL